MTVPPLGFITEILEIILRACGPLSREDRVLRKQKPRPLRGEVCNLKELAKPQNLQKHDFVTLTLKPKP